MTYRKETKDLVRILRSEGAEVTRMKSGHYRVRHPITGRTVCVGSTPSDKRTMLNDVSRLRRIGFLLRWRRGTAQTPRPEHDLDR